MREGCRQAGLEKTDHATVIHDHLVIAMRIRLSVHIKRKLQTCALNPYRCFRLKNTSLSMAGRSEKLMWVPSTMPTAPTKPDRWAIRLEISLRCSQLTNSLARRTRAEMTRSVYNVTVPLATPAVRAILLTAAPFPFIPSHSKANAS
ncbi:hypothetical protein PsorP6_015274 [Peronosclerospora sorghi]|uniref:Uncharacterized protein n=1 Tax=Peronosclerospora sorghi TaxID=230839 RepID=A0ACC0VSX5_9STRA|nr:hypothetical protein PsorP6_015274 [Peronosclerospora sorghi]